MTVTGADALIPLLCRALATVEPVPEHVLAGARSAFTWRTIDAELAELVFDSAGDRAGVRTEAVNRQVTFSSPGAEIELTVIDDGSRRLLGQLVPPVAATIELVSCDDSRTTNADRLGRFGFVGVSDGPLRLVVHGTAGTRTVQTEILL